MCPLWPLHYLLLLWPLFVAAQVAMAGKASLVRAPRRTLSASSSSSASSATYSAVPARLACDLPAGASYLDVQFSALLANGTLVDVFDSAGAPGAASGLQLKLDEQAALRFRTSDLSAEDMYSELYVEAADQTVADTDVKKIEMRTLTQDGASWTGAFNVSARFLGKTSVRLRLHNRAAGLSAQRDRLSDCVPVVVTRPKRVIDTVFTASVASLVAIIFVNFGCALDWDLVRKTVRRPVGPAIGFTSQYLVLPLISFGLAKLLFPDNISMQLGMFFTGISPGGGASNIWTYLLGGNLNLSITMTSISTLAAFGMMPFWIFTLGHQIFSEGKLAVPYTRVVEVAVALVIPVFIGWLIQKYLPRVSKFLVRILKPFSTLLIAFIVVFAIITNLYIFKLFSWKIVLAGLGIPWLGYLTGLLLALAFKQTIPDMLAISVETGVHNTGISIFMLRAALGQPEADLTTVVPVAVAIMTPVPLTIWYVVKQLRSRWNVKKGMFALSDEEKTPVTNNHNEPLTVITSKGVANNNQDKF